MALMAKHLSGSGFTAEDITDCRHIIMATILTLPLEEIPFRSDEMRTMGKILGSADLIAQMADRNYLEKLPLLFLEYKEAGIPAFATPLELFKKTEEFYHSVARARLTNGMDDIASAVRHHFRQRWGIDRDLYAESIKNNINYLKKIYEECGESYEYLLTKIRRGNPPA